MSRTDLERIANTVVRRAQRQGFVVPREIREELADAGLAVSRWKDVLALAGWSLRYRHGRYYHVPAVQARIQARRQQQQTQQQAIQRAVRRLVRHYKEATVRFERREYGRSHFIRPVQAQTESGRKLTLLTRDISVSGIRLLSATSLLGQQLRLSIRRAENGPEAYCFVVRILWSAIIADGLYDNGGIFVDIEPAEGQPLKIMRQE